MASFVAWPPRSLTLPGTVRQRIAAVALLLAVGGLIIGGWLEFRAANRVGNVSGLSASAIAAADTKVVQLTTFKGEATSAAIFTGVTDRFKKAYASQVGLFTSAIASSKVVSTAAVDASGVVTADSSHATVLVATSGSVSTAGGAAQRRYFRFEVALVRSGDAWLVDDVRFVQ